MTTATTGRQAVRLAQMPKVNLLPPEIEERQRFRRVQLGLGAAVVAAFGVVGGLWVMANQSAHDAAADLATEQRTTTSLRQQIDGYAEVPRVYAQVAASEALLTQAMGKEVRWSYYLNDLSLTIPANVWLSNVTIQQRDDGTPTAGAGSTASAGTPADANATPSLGEITFQGVAFRHDDVAVWLETLGKQKAYADPYFSTSTESYLGPRKIVNFTSTVKVTEQALSGRYTKPAGG